MSSAITSVEDHINPDPEAWPACAECEVAWVLRRCLSLTKGWIWLWQRDCKHKKLEPVIKKATA